MGPAISRLALPLIMNPMYQCIPHLTGHCPESKPGFEQGLFGWTLGGPENGSLALASDADFVQAGGQSVDLNRTGGGYVRLIGDYVLLQAGRTYEFSMDFKDYGTSMYSGDQFQLNNANGTVSYGDPIFTDLGNNWKRLTRTLTPDTNAQYSIHFAKYKPGQQYIDNAVVLDITDDDGDGVPHYLENISLAGYGNDPFFFIRVEAKDEDNTTVEGNFTVTLLQQPTEIFTVSEGRVPIHTTQSQIPMDSP